MSRKDKLSGQHRQETERVRAWLRPFMEDNKPKIATKEELWSVAKSDFGVSRSSFNLGWGLAIHDTGREDWYDPLRKRFRKQ
jgi:hypothetical protein